MLLCRSLPLCPAAAQLPLRELSRAASASLCHLATATVAGADQAAGQSSLPGSGGARWWTAVAAAVGAVVTAAGSATALAESGNSLPASKPQATEADGVSAGGKLLSLPMRQRIFFK